MSDGARYSVVLFFSVWNYSDQMVYSGCRNRGLPLSNALKRDCVHFYVIRPRLTGGQSLPHSSNRASIPTRAFL
jgi:hypothetical protein